MPDCVFCRIVAGEIPCHKIYDDGRFFAFLDIGPNNVGHALVIPRGHHESFGDAPPAVLAELCPVVQRVAKACAAAVNAPAFNVIVNNGAAAGQVVPHLHVHVIPRFADDGYRPWGKIEVSSERMAEIARAVAARLG